MQRRNARSRWAGVIWEPVSVLESAEPPGAARLLVKQDDCEQWLHPGFAVEIHRDEIEGYYMNVSSGSPRVFVLWRMDEEATIAAEPIARVQAVSLSYHDAGRWLDAQELVDQVPAAPEVVQWLTEFASAHFQPEPKRRKRPESFKPLTDRFGNPASVSTGRVERGGQQGGGHG